MLLKLLWFSAMFLATVWIMFLTPLGFGIFVVHHEKTQTITTDGQHGSQ
jgi:hypothetical protein